MNGPVTPFVPWPADLVLILASASPRRAQLLELAGIPHDVRPAPESAEDEVAASFTDARRQPGPYAVALAEAKADAVAVGHPGRLVLGADTIVILDGDVLGKPRDEDEAARMLGRLQGRRHSVITAMALLGAPGESRWTAWEETRVEFLPLDERAIRAYVATGEPMDKAGAYGIQGFGAMMVRRVEGSYFNVMGLPLALLGEALRELLPAEPDRSID